MSPATTCIDCGTEIPRGSRCRKDHKVLERRRNRDPKRSGYRDPLYLSQPATGLCAACGKPGADTRGHIVALAHDYGSTETVPMHRSCNSAQGAKTWQR